jgi:hypothetical protein
MRVSSSPALLTVAALALAGCDRTDAPAASTRGDAGSSAPGSTPAALPVRTAAKPRDACGWISAAEVEAVIGSLAGPPRTVQNGCLFPVPIDSLTARRREAAKKLEQLARDLEEHFGPPTDTLRVEPPETAVIVDVSIADPVQERGMTAGYNLVASLAGGRAANEGSAYDTAAPPPPIEPPAGWDRFLPKISVLSPELALGVGYLAVRIVRQTPAVSPEQALELANRIRASVPDLPYSSDVPPGMLRVAGLGAEHDPCSLLAAGEAEAVLGKLVVPPYRAQEGSYLAHEQGPACAYYTAGHRALVVTPTWEYGGMEVEAIRGVGGLIGQIAPTLLESPADTLDEVWEEVGADATTGELYFLEGERLLKVGYLASSTDANGAVELARLAMRRLTRDAEGR